MSPPSSPLKKMLGASTTTAAAAASRTTPSPSAKRTMTSSSSSSPNKKKIKQDKQTNDVAAADEVKTTTEKTPVTAGASASETQAMTTMKPQTFPKSKGVERKPQQQQNEGKLIRLLSWNLNGLRATMKNKHALFTSYLKKENPDLIFLHETKLQEQNVAEFRNMLPGYEGYFSCSKPPAKLGYSGTCLLVRNGLKPIKVEYALPNSKFNSEGRIIMAEFESFHFLGMYVVNSGQSLERLDDRVKNFDKAVKEQVEKLNQTKPCIVAGDLNVAHLDADIWNCGSKHIKKQAGTTDEERASFGDLLKSQKMVDTFRHFHPQATGWFTYFSARTFARNTNKGLRLDYFLVPASMIDEDGKKEENKSSQQLRLHDAWIDSDFPDGITDHAPVFMDMLLKQA